MLVTQLSFRRIDMQCQPSARCRSQVLLGAADIQQAPDKQDAGDATLVLAALPAKGKVCLATVPFPVTGRSAPKSRAMACLLI